MVKEIEELRLKESAAVEEQKKLSRSVRYQIMMTTMTIMATTMATRLSNGSPMDLGRTDHFWSLQ